MYRLNHAIISSYTQITMRMIMFNLVYMNHVTSIYRERDGNTSQFMYSSDETSSK